jgi:hypothetical protein
MIHAAAAQPSGSASTAAGRPGRGLSRPLIRKQLARLAAVQLEVGAVMARIIATAGITEPVGAGLGVTCAD